MAEQERKGPVDTSHLYDGKVVRSSAPSRKKAAGTLKADSGIPDDAVPEVEIPNWIDAIFGIIKSGFLPSKSPFFILVLFVSVLVSVFPALQAYKHSINDGI